jgi:hypothetical protein
MFLSEKTPEFLVVETLSKGPCSSSKLLVSLQKIYPTFTKQALHYLLRKMINEETLTKAHGCFSLHLPWIHKLNRFVRNSYSSIGYLDSDQNPLLKLVDGEKVSYTFSTPILADQYWNHVYEILRNYNKQEVSYTHVPHQTFFIARPDAQQEWLSSFEKRKRYSCYTIASNSLLDSFFKNKWRSEYFKINIESNDRTSNKKFPRNYYVNVMGDWITELFLSEKTAELIDKFFENQKYQSKRVCTELHSLLSQKDTKTKLVISRNSKKASKLKKFLSKDFPVSQ